jgi:RNA polymerase sigma-70 factor (ECF subfamily)
MPADPGSGDRALVARVADRDGAALGALYDRYGRTLFSLAYRILGDGDDAEEVVMDAMAQAWRSAADYSSERGSVAAWLVVLVRSRALDRLRARRRQERALDRASSLTPETAPGMGSALEGAGAAAEAGDRRSRVLAALRELPESQRVCLELAYYEGLTQTQIAARLDEPLGTVKTRMRLGLIKLRESLQPAIMELEA